MIALFLGGFVQWAVTGAATRFLASGDVASTFVTVAVMQTLWWANIQNCTRTSRRRDALMWISGAATGAVVGIWVS